MNTGEKKIPIIYEIAIGKFVEKVNDTKELGASLSMNDITLILGKIFHIPKCYHYAVIREFEEFGILKFSKDGMKLMERKHKGIRF